MSVVFVVRGIANMVGWFDIRHFTTTIRTVSDIGHRVELRINRESYINVQPNYYTEAVNVIDELIEK